jgi:hypothetical protein
MRVIGNFKYCLPLYSSIMYFSSFLKEVRKRAIRGNVWFRTLDCLERGILNLSAKILDVIHSESLQVELSKIVSKIEDALRGVFEKRFLSYGLSRAKEIVANAVKLGCNDAVGWLTNSSFAKYVTFMSLNNSFG